MNLQLYNPNQIICGCDEAGRGALAGPVVASAVILPNNFFHIQFLRPNIQNTICKKCHDKNQVLP